MRIQTLLTWVLGAAVAFAQPAGKPGVPNSYKDIQLPPLNTIKVTQPARFELPNGMVLYLIEDHELPTVSMSARIRTGERFDPPAKAGLASLVGTVMRTGGTPTRPGNKLDEELDRIGASVETGIGMTMGTAGVSVLKEDADRALAILADLLQNPAFPQDKIDLAKTEQRDGIARRNDDPGGIASREATRILYGKNSPYAINTEYATLDNITRQDMVAFHKRYFQPENVILGAWGDFKVDEMRARIEKAFAGWKKGGQPVPPLPEISQDVTQRRGIYLIAKDDVNQSNIRMVALGGRRDNPDYFALTVMSEILGGGFSSRLFNVVRSEQGLAYGVGAGWAAQYDYPGTYLAAGSTKSETTVAFIKSVRAEIDKFLQKGIEETELNFAKNALQKSFVFSTASTGQIVGRQLDYAYYGYPADFLQRYQQNITKVTKADVERVARQYWKPEEMITVVVGNPKDFDAQLDSLGQPVTKWDISIPAPKGQEVSAATPETTERGKALLAKARQAMGGAAIDQVQNVTTKSTLTLNTPQGAMALKTETVVTRDGKLRSVMNTPMGSVVQIYNGKSGYAQMPGRPTQELAGPQAAEMAKSEARETLSLLRTDRMSKLEVQALGVQDFQGQQAEALLVKDPAAGVEVRLFLDPQTGRVVGRQYTAALMGPPADIQERVTAYREVSGVQLPSAVTLSRSGQQMGEVKVDDVQVNAGAPDTLFAKP